MNPIKIIIDDENYYFSLGLQQCIAGYAQENNKPVRFLSPKDDERPHIVFTTPARRRTHWCASWFLGSVQFVLIREKALGIKNDIGCEVYRAGAADALPPLLARLFSDNECVLPGATPEQVRRFTVREKQVMNFLRSGHEQSEVARMMGVSVKTVHSHKRSAMNKLCLTRRHDFIYWLLSYEGYFI